MNTIDIIITGPQGSGKTLLTSHLADLLKQHPAPVQATIRIYDGQEILTVRPPITRGTYRTRNGDTLRVVCADIRHEYPVLGLRFNGEIDEANRFDAYGKSNRASAMDLVERISDEF